MAIAPSTLSTAYLTALLQAAKVPAATVQRLIGAPTQASADAGAPSLADTRLSQTQFAAAYRELAIALDDEMLGLFSRAFRPGALKFTCLALLDAKNLMVAMHRWSCISRLVQDDFHIELECRGTIARIALVPMAGRSHRQPFALDMMLKVIHGVASWLVGERIALTRVDFPFERPTYAADYLTLYPGPVSFDQALPALHLDAETLQRPIRRDKHELNEFLLRAPEDWLFAGQREERLSQRLRAYLADRLPLPATAESAAEALQVSTRTLHRKLAEEDTSFQRVKDEFRRDRAMQLLTKSQQPINTISAQLGFDSAASFHRAFRGWTGDTPGAFRGSGTAPR